MSRLEEFNANRSLLFSIAYRMLGSRADAEDAVQETFLRWQNASDQEVRSARSYLASVVTRLCIDNLKSARAQREVYVGAWLPEPIMTTFASHAGDHVELAESLTMAFMVLLESLAPAERAAFLLHEVFDYDYSEIAAILEKSEANCRQMAHRARDHISRRHRRFDPSREETQTITARFLQTARDGDVKGLMSLFVENAVLMSDGGGKVRAALNTVTGADPIARFVVGVTRKGLQPDATVTMSELNGQPALVVTRHGAVKSATILDIRDGLIRNLFIIVNPDKLRRLSL
ncbi:MAG TPA: RNA polymerase sigma-70 factor [Terriglobia bacterium]|nr:RNA polymerase sigma-70 factor [Terriglobia bacterium]